jgi:hypothetical protein
MTPKGKQARRYAPKQPPIGTSDPRLLAWLTLELSNIAQTLARIEDELAAKQDKT